MLGPSSDLDSLLERTGEALAARGVPLDEVLALARAAAAAALDSLGSDRDATPSDLGEAERRRSKALARVWSDCGSAGCDAAALVGRGQDGFLAARPGTDGLVGVSDGMKLIRAAAAAAAAASQPLLVTGEPGSGKEFLARAIHHRRGWGRFESVDCVRLTPVRAEDDLFARLGGRSSGAIGTLFLDEVTELSPDLQARLLTLLEGMEASPAKGAEGTLVVLATRWDPAAAIDDGLLRPGLVRLLRSCHIHLPPLRERPEDIRPLTEHFLGSFCARRCGCIRGVTGEAMDALEGCRWPGNVRELRDAVRHAVASGGEGTIEPGDLPASVFAGEAPEAPEAGAGATLAEMEREIVKDTLARFAGNKSRTAKALGISRHKLYDVLRSDG